jgi:hypothetical protein
MIVIPAKELLFSFRCALLRRSGYAEAQSHSCMFSSLLSKKISRKGAKTQR